MISRLARRLGFQQSVPVAMIDDWVVVTPRRSTIELAPREGAASCLVDQFGRIQVDGACWTLDLTLAAGARWVPLTTAERVTQAVLSPAVVETTVQTPAGPVVQRVAAGVVDSKPVAIVEIENTGGVAIAAGIVVRPIQLDGRGFIGEVSVGSGGVEVDGRSAVRFASKPASVRVSDGASGDLLQHMPGADDGTPEAETKCRSGGAQAAAVWPVPHTATIRLVIELDEPTAPTAAVPTTEDINRGWGAHLKQGMRVDVDGLDVADHVGVAARSALTLWPEIEDTPSAILALAETGFGRDAGRFFARLERCEEDDRVLRSLARWAQLGEQAHQLEDLERILGRLAQAAHGVAARGGEVAGPAWLDDAMVTLGGRLHQIGQPDVADRVHSFRAVEQGLTGAADELARLDKERDKRGVWPAGQMASASRYLRMLRSVVIDDAGAELRLLPELPKLWRGRAIDVFVMPVANGHVSFGLRWHGPRPALLWEATLAPEAPLRITVPGIDPAFSSVEREGEALLADPGWQTS